MDGNQDEAEREREARALAQLLNKRVVTIGGGTGPFGVLTSLKRFPCSITAIVTMADSGGSSRRLMDEFGHLVPVGDLRQALVALSRKGALWRDVFTFRFREGHGQRETQVLAGGPDDSLAQRVAEQAGVGGHSLGNLIISALQELNDGKLLRAIEDAQELLDTAGKVLPVTLEHITLCAELADGKVITGETNIDTRGKRNPGPIPAIKRVFLQEDAPACEEAIRAIKRADVIVLGPGDLYTSVLPNLLVPGVADALRASEARKIYICNLMTKHGETDGFRAADFVREVHRYLGGRVDRVIAHDGSFPPHLLGLYAAEDQHPVKADEKALRQLVPDVVVERLLAIHQDHLVRHDAERLVWAIFAPPNFSLWDSAEVETPPVTRGVKRGQGAAKLASNGTGMGRRSPKTTRE
jgi:uncharacterized cofD-like protein